MPILFAASVGRKTFHPHILNMNTADGDVSYRLASSLGLSSFRGGLTHSAGTILRVA